MVIIDTKTDEYYCGLNTWSKQLRNAKVYHSEKYVQNAITSICSRRDTGIKNVPSDFIVGNIKMAVDR